MKRIKLTQLFVITLLLMLSLFGISFIFASRIDFMNELLGWLMCPGIYIQIYFFKNVHNISIGTIFVSFIIDWLLLSGVLFLIKLGTKRKCSDQ